MSLIEVKQGGSDLPPGVYTVFLKSIDGPKTVVAQRGPNAGQEIDLLDWTYVVADGPHEGEEVQASSSTSSGPRSKIYAWLTALFNGVPPATGAQFDPPDLIGKYALATISKSEDGWPRIENLGAIPAGMLAQKVAAATGAPVMPTGAPAPAAQQQPVAAAVAQTGDLPF